MIVREHLRLIVVLNRKLTFMLVANNLSEKF